MDRFPATEPVQGLIPQTLEVALALPLHDTFTYLNPNPEQTIPLGTQVIVPFGTQIITGYVIGYSQVQKETTRFIKSIVEQSVPVSPEILALCHWAAQYYQYPIGQVISSAIPRLERTRSIRKVFITEKGINELVNFETGKRSLSGLTLSLEDLHYLAQFSPNKGRSLSWLSRSCKGNAHQYEHLEKHGFLEIIHLLERHTSRGKPKATFSSSALETAIHKLNRFQEAALEEIASVLGHNFQTFLLHGITGSGKTEVYMRAIALAKKIGKSAIILVPEISLTPQLEERFKNRFGNEIAVLHSGLSTADRVHAWRRLQQGEATIALGARSAIFAPVQSLGIVVVDEEHDGSFKQDNGLRYNARDLAIIRAKGAGAIALLGSATPSLESFWNVQRGRFKKLDIPIRATPAAAMRPLPKVTLIDLKTHPLGPDKLFSAPFLQKINETLQAGDQVILYLNRRGYSTSVICTGCGKVLACNQCSVSLTLHRNRSLLICHYCGISTRIPNACPSCSSQELLHTGSGTERTHAVISEKFPNARIARLDRDTTLGDKRKFEAIHTQMHRREIDILIGTQMVAKGHDFPGVTLVGILQPEHTIHLPDFRATERSFQLMEQVAGRAGRGEKPGHVIIQTYCPEHIAIHALLTHDYEAFVNEELKQRRAAQYPPFTRMIAIHIEGKEVNQVRNTATLIAENTRQTCDENVRILGPSEAPIAKIRGKHRYQVWLVGTDRKKLANAAQIAHQYKTNKMVTIQIDVDPQSSL
jgi:primosomal protein N' (replication factor Y)